MMKEYLSNTIEFVIEKVEEIMLEFDQDYTHPQKGSSPQQKQVRDKKEVFKFELSKKQYDELIDDMKAFYGMN